MLARKVCGRSGTAAHRCMRPSTVRGSHRRPCSRHPLRRATPPVRPNGPSIPLSHPSERCGVTPATVGPSGNRARPPGRTSAPWEIPQRGSGTVDSNRDHRARVTDARSVDGRGAGPGTRDGKDTRSSRILIAWCTVTDRCSASVPSFPSPTAHHPNRPTGRADRPPHQADSPRAPGGWGRYRRQAQPCPRVVGRGSSRASRAGACESLSAGPGRHRPSLLDRINNELGWAAVVPRLRGTCSGPLRRGTTLVGHAASRRRSQVGWIRSTRRARPPCHLDAVHDDHLVSVAPPVPQPASRAETGPGACGLAQRTGRPPTQDRAARRHGLQPRTTEESVAGVPTALPGPATSVAQAHTALRTVVTELPCPPP